MTTSNRNELDLAAFADLLETCGSDAARWPAARRQEAEALLAREAGARRLLEEARALDRVLGRASGAAAPRSGLVDRIVARSLGREAPPRDNVVPLAVRRRPPPAVAGAAAPLMQRPRRAGLWQAAAVLVLALSTGMLLGALDVLPLGGLVELGAADGDIEQTVASVSLEGLSPYLEEDQL
jgi:hypothetical protein